MESTMRVGWKGKLVAESRVEMPVRTRTVRMPASMPEMMSVSMRSPIMTLDSEWASMARRAERIMSGLGLPT
jgi:hypothetical protein